VNLEDVPIIWRLVTPAAVILAVASGAAFGWLVRSLRPNSDRHAVTFLMGTAGSLWYVGQWVGQVAAGEVGWGTVARGGLFMLGFVPAMWIVMRWRS